MNKLKFLFSFLLIIFYSGASFSEVAPSDVVADEYGAVTASLTGVAGDPANGRKVFMNRKQGNCLACHVNSEMSEQTFHGAVGPVLDGVADRWTAAELRGMLVNSKKVFLRSKQTLLEFMKKERLEFWIVFKILSFQREVLFH